MIKIVIFYVTLEFLNLVNLQPSHIQHFSTFSSFKVTIKKKKDMAIKFYGNIMNNIFQYFLFIYILYCKLHKYV